MMQTAGFWVRVGAYLIDAIILVVVSVILALVFGGSIDAVTDSTEYTWVDGASNILALAYFAAFNGSAMQGTPGKRALGLVVTDLHGNRISYLRSVGRYFAQILSVIILMIGYIMVAFTERNQGLHDIICSTLVLHGNPGETAVDTDVFA